MFNYFGYFTRNLLFPTTEAQIYKPYISYNWTTSTQTNKRYLNNVGELVLDAEMFTGQGIYFNGTNQKINTLTTYNNTATSRIYTKNGLTVYEEAPLNDGYPSEGIYQNLIYFNTTLSIDLQERFTSSPEIFIYKDNDGIIKSDLGLDINTVMEWFPLCELDNYIRAMKSYNEVEKYNPANVAISGNNANNSWTDNLDGSFTLTQTDFTSTPLLDTGIALVGGKRYVVDAEILNYTNGALTSDNTVIINIFNSNGKKYAVLTAIANGNFILKMNVVPTNLTIKINSIKEVTSGIYSISGFTSSCITGAQQLPYGLQTGKIIQNSLGMYLSSTPYLEFNKASYIDTKWTPDITNKITVEMIIDKKTTDVSNQLNGSDNLRIGMVNKSLFYKVADIESNIPNTLLDTVYYIALTLDGTTAKVYLNGILVDTKSYLPNNLIGNGTDYFAIDGEYISLNTNIETFKLGMVSNITAPMVSPIKFFKVNLKQLNDSQILASYNKCLNQGLIAPSNAIGNGVDFFGIDGQYIILGE